MVTRLVLHKHLSLSVSKQMLGLLSTHEALFFGSEVIKPLKILSLFMWISINHCGFEVTFLTSHPTLHLSSSSYSTPLSVSPGVRRSLTRSPLRQPPHCCFLQRAHWSLADTDRHLRESHWFLCVSVSVQQQGSRCEIRLHAEANWTQGSLTCTADHARYLAYLNLLIRHVWVRLLLVIWSKNKLNNKVAVR